MLTFSKAAAAVLVLPCVYSSFALAQAYPAKPVRIVTSGIGGGNDFIARIVAPRLSTNLGQPVTIDNRGSGVIPGEIVSKAPGDGYTLLVIGGSLWIGTLLRTNSPYDPIKDFAPITAAARAPSILVVHPSLPVKSVKELIALAKAKPGVLNTSVGATGGASHLAAELFRAMAATNIVIVPYKSGSQETADLLSGYVQLTFGSAGSVAPHIKSGRLKPLGVTSIQPSVLVPGIPPIAEAGVPGYEAVAIYGVLAPATTPIAIVRRLNQEIVKILSQTDVREKFLSSGVEVVGNSPEDFASTIKMEMARLGKVIKEAGIKEE